MSARKLVSDVLDGLGLNANEAGAYLASLELGPSPASAIARRAGLNRVTAYEALRRLSRRGLVRAYAKRGVRTFDAESVDTLIAKLEEAREEAGRRAALLAERREEIARLYRKTDKPDVSYYEGTEGLKTMIMDTLAARPDETLSFASGSAILGFDDAFVQRYYDKRVSLKIPTRAIAPGTPEVRGRYPDQVNRRELRQMKFLDPKLDRLQHEIEIYGDRVAFMSLERGNEHGAIVRSRAIAEAMREIFNALWARL